jgi:hypothetical protein
MIEAQQTKVSLIKNHLFNDFGILRSLKSKKRNYIGRHMTIKVINNSEELVYLDVNPNNQLDGFNCYIKKNEVTIPKKYEKPIMIGLDTSYGNQYYFKKGTACYGWATVLTSSVDGNVSEEVLTEVRKLNRYVIMMSDKVFDQKQGKSCIVPHYILQENMFNMLKVVSEGSMISKSLSNVTNTLSSYGYKYDLNNHNRTIIIKDGPLLSGFFEPFGNALLSNKFPDRLEDEHEIYKTVALAGLRGIPIIGITKHPIYSILAQHFGETDVLDYSIVKQIAEGDSYFYLGPYERKHTKNHGFRIHYYYLYLEDRFSPLRLEIIPDLLPQGLNGNKLVEDIVMALKCSDDGEISNNKEDYKLPPCIATVDQITREIVKQKSAELKEALEDLQKRKIPDVFLDYRM